MAIFAIILLNLNCQPKCKQVHPNAATLKQNGIFSLDGPWMVNAWKRQSLNSSIGMFADLPQSKRQDQMGT
jgi:hypothetical protein